MFLISIFAHLLGILIIFGIIMLIVKCRGFHPQKFSLLEGEEIIKMAKGDYWQDSMFSKTQLSGEFAFTNKRVMFVPYFCLADNQKVTIPLENIESIEKTLLKNIFPVAFVINTKDEESYEFAIMKRDIYIDLIESLIQKQD